jgi:hypothetical protein
MEPRSVQDSTKDQAQRFAAAVVAAVMATVFIMPLAMHHGADSRGSVIRVALVPAAAAWLILWKMPGSQRLALFRTVMLTIALVGAGGLALHGVSQLTSPWIKETVESARFVPQAIMYLIAGVLGVLGSTMFDADRDG